MSKKWKRNIKQAKKDVKGFVKDNRRRTIFILLGVLLITIYLLGYITFTTNPGDCPDCP